MAYGNYLYGTYQFGAGEMDIIPEDHAADLMKYLPPYWHEIREMKELQEILGIKVSALKVATGDILNQFFVSTATWGLDLWEREFGLQTDRSKSYERRREIILAKLRGAGTTTKTMIKSVAIAFSGGEVEVHEHPAEYRFEIQFVGVKGIPPNMAGLIQAIENIKPAHLVYSFKYTFTTWSMVAGLSWAEVANKTWAELRMYEGE